MSLTSSPKHLLYLMILLKNSLCRVDVERLSLVDEKGIASESVFSLSNYLAERLFAPYRTLRMNVNLCGHHRAQ